MELVGEFGLKDFQTRIQECGAKGYKNFLTIAKSSVAKIRSRNWKVVFTPVVKQTTAACIVGTLVISCSIFYYNHRKTGYEVSFNGKMLGYVHETKVANDALQTAKEIVIKQYPNVVLNDELKLEKIKLNTQKLADINTLEEGIESNLYIKLTTYVVTINGNQTASVNTKEEAKQVIDGIKKYFEEQEVKNGAESVSVNIKDDIKIASKIADDSKIVDAQSAINSIVTSKNASAKYEIKQGDSLWTIAKNNNMKVEEIVSINPNFDPEKLQLGQTINLAKIEPNINVEVTLKIATEEEVAFETKYITDSNIYKGKTKVVEDGQNGINKIINQVIKLNGVEVARTALTAALVKSPVAQVIARGTKDLIGTGTFSWPAKGNLTSGFGNRSGEFHKGIDVCAPEGTPIYAADGGTVIQAGWYYGYGNLVIIDHRNGFKTYYGHCSKVNVSVGQTVERGQNIAAMGHTGDAYGNHVHFEVRLNGTALDPRTYLK